MAQNDILLLALMWFAQFCLMFIQVFRFNLLFSAASLLLSAAMSQLAGVPGALNLADWLVGWAQIAAGLLIVAFGKKGGKDSHLG